MNFIIILLFFMTSSFPRHSHRGGGGTPYSGLWEVSPKRGTLFMLRVYKRVGISQVEVYEKVRKSEYLGTHHNMNGTNSTG